VSQRGKVIGIILTVCLTIGLIQSVTYAKEATTSKESSTNAAASTKNQILSPVSLGTVKLKENVTVTVKNLLLMPADSNQIVGVTLSINNNSNSEINFLDYWVNLSTKSGTKLNVQTVNKNKSKIPAKSTVDINFIAEAGNDIKLTDLIVKVIRWDFSATDYTKVLGQISVAQSYSPITPGGKGRSIVADDVTASFVIKQAVIGKSESYFRPEIKLTIKNDGKRSIVLPDYQFYIMTSDNLMYPISVANVKGAVLNPLTEKDFQLTVSIPKGAKEKGWKLAVMYPIDEGKSKYPLGIFELPKASTGTAEEIGKYYSFSNNKGVYYIKLDSINRLPLEDDDLVVANMTIANKGDETLPIPTISGKYMFNESIEKAASATNNDKIISIKPGATAKIQLVSRVPYTFDISKMKLIVQQKESKGNTEDEVTDLVEFTHSGTFDQVPKVKWNVGFKLSEVGYRSEVTASNKMVFTGATADIIAVQLVINNKEKRTTNIQTLAGYFEKPDGRVYTATLDNIAEKVTAGGSAYVYAWATIPKDVDTSDMTLIVGKAVTEKTSSSTQAGEVTESLVGYTDPYSIILPSELVPQEHLQKIALPPYSLSIKKADTKIDYKNSTVHLKMTYDLKQDLTVKANTKNDKIVIEIKDSNYKSNFTKEFSLPAGVVANNSEASALSLGENTIEFNWTDEQFVLQIQNLKDYQFNVYYQRQSGYKKLIATEKIPWYVERTLQEK